jgi:hypothetical protein
MEVNHDKKNEAFTYGVISPVIITYHRWKLTGVACDTVGKDKYFVPNCGKNLTSATKEQSSVLCEGA